MIGKPSSDTTKKHTFYNFSLIFRHNRQWRLIVSQLSVNADHRKTLRKLESDEPSVFMMRKCFGENTNVLQLQQLCKDGLPFKYPSVLKVFCLLFY
jgi:hypothetical protein